MITKTLVSPVGEEIQLISDAEWAATSGASEKAVRMWGAGTKRFVVAALWEHGAFVDPKGHAIVDMCHWVERQYGIPVHNGAFTGLIRDPVNALAFERVATRQKRTDAIKLIAMPDTWWEKLQWTLEHEIPELRKQAGTWEPIAPPAPETNGHGPPKAEDGPPESVPPQSDDAPPVSDEEWHAVTAGIELDAPTTYDVGPPLDLQIANSVALAMLTQVVEIISAGTPEQTDARVRSLTADLTEVSGRLAQRLQENDRMRRQLREAGDEINALRHERDGLRSRLRATEHNLKEAMSGDTVRMINEEVRKRIDQFMRTAPTSKKAKDDG